MPRWGYRTQPRVQPRVSTLGIVHQEQRALKGAPDRTSKQGGSAVRLSHVSIAHSDFCAATNASFIWYPHLSSLQGEPFIMRVPRVETLG